MDVHGQGVTVLNQLIEQVGPDRLLGLASDTL
jgi:hypothetical protein